MSTLEKSRKCVIDSLVGIVLCGIGGAVTPVSAQNETSPAPCPPVAVGVAAMPGADPMADAAITQRVQAALHADQYFYDEHVQVSMEAGAIVLRGFVFSEWDLRDAIQIAKGGACRLRVIDELSIKVGGRR